ncbi:MAG: hypothetical protein U7123_07325 [Potamolinea sp.]
MALTLNIGSLKATGLRIIRKLAFNFSGRPQTNSDGGILGAAWNWLTGAVGWLFSAIGNIFSFTLTTLWGWLVKTTAFLWNFNWNITDEGIDKSIEANFNSLAARIGEASGEAVGTIVGAGLLGGTLFLFNPNVARQAIANAAPEIADEIISNLSAIMKGCGQTLTQSAILWGYKNIRALLKESPTVISAILGPDGVEASKKWGEKGAEPWSFALQYEKWLDTLGDGWERNFVENFLEGLAEGIVEGGFILASEYDQIKRMQSQRQEILGQRRTVEVRYDRDIPEERIVVRGREELIRNSLPQQLATYNMLRNRDVGQWVGLPYLDWARNNPSAIALTIFWSNRAPGKQRVEGERLTRMQVHLEDLKSSKLDWETIKNAAGRLGHNWGPWSARGTLSTKKAIKIYGATERDAIERLESLVQLIDGDLLSINATEEKRFGRRASNQSMRKDPTRVYPNYCCLLVAQKSLRSEDTRGTLSGDYKYHRFRVELFPERKPSTADDILKESVRLVGTGLIG